MSILKFRSHRQKENFRQGWDNQELSEFYRIEDILKRGGLLVDVDQGVSDVGDPWFVFCRAENGEVIAHFARIDGVFISVSGITQEIYRGYDVRQVVDPMLDRHPMLISKSKSESKVLLHPGAVLAAFVTAAFLLSIDESKAMTLENVLVEMLPREADSADKSDVPLQDSTFLVDRERLRS